MKAILILVEALKNRDSIYSLSDSKLTDAIKEAEGMQDKAQILILELKAKHKQEIKELKLKFIEDVSKSKGYIMKSEKIKILKRLMQINSELQALTKYYK